MNSKGANNITAFVNEFKGEAYTYGLKVYDMLIRYIDNIKSSELYVDIRPFHVIYDHKKYVIYIIEKLFETRNLKNASYYYKEYMSICKEALFTSSGER